MLYIFDIFVSLIQIWLVLLLVPNNKLDYYILSPFIWMLLISIIKLYFIINNFIKKQTQYILYFDILLVLYSFMYNPPKMIIYDSNLFGFAVYISIIYELIFIVRKLKI